MQQPGQGECLGCCIFLYWMPEEFFKGWGVDSGWGLADGRRTEQFFPSDVPLPKSKKF